jgi:hypothetical protein
MKDWTDGGEEWSKPWGNSAAQWAGVIFPRIRDCLPAGTILEIAPGFGRWTHYLKNHCDNLWLVEKADQCFEACCRRFGNEPRIKIYHNDGHSLSMLPDNSVDFVFSFDSLVHDRRGFIQSYLHQLGSKLKVGGKGFLHHSNLGAYANSERRPTAVVKLLEKAGILDLQHHRTDHDCRFVSCFVRATRAALCEAGVDQLACAPTNRLLFLLRAGPISTNKAH